MKFFIILSVLIISHVHATPISDALSDCLVSSQTKLKSTVITHPKINKISVDGKDDVTFGISCEGDSARNLYNEANKLGGYDQGSRGYGYFESIWADGTTIRTIYLGNGVVNGLTSACYSRVMDRNRNPIENNFWCHLILDIKRDVLANLDLKTSIKTEAIQPEAPPKKGTPKAVKLQAKP